MKTVSDADWKELKALLLDKSKHHDEMTAFSTKNMGLSVFIEMATDVYECGRSQTLPEQWKDAYHVMKQRQGIAFQTYLKRKRELAEMEAQFEPLESLDMTELTGGPMKKFLRKKTKEK